MLTDECFLSRNSDSPQKLSARARKNPADFEPNMKIALLLVLMSTIVMIAYLAVPARSVAEAEAHQ